MIYVVPLASSEYNKCRFKAVIAIKGVFKFLNDMIQLFEL